MIANDNDLDSYEWNYGFIDTKYHLDGAESKTDDKSNCANICKSHGDNCKAAIYNPTSKQCIIAKSVQPGYNGIGYKNEYAKYSR